jgi:hypothetical protein
VFSNLFSITLPNIGKYFPGIHFSGIHFPKRNYFPANKWDLSMIFEKILICGRTGGKLDVDEGRR